MDLICHLSYLVVRQTLIDWYYYYLIIWYYYYLSIWYYYYINFYYQYFPDDLNTFRLIH